MLLQNDFIIALTAMLDKQKTKKQIDADLKQIEQTINMLRITGTFTEEDTKRELNQYLKLLESQLNYIKLKAKIDDQNLSKEIEKALNNISYKDIDLLDVDENKTILKVKKVIADAKAYVSKSPISVNIEAKKEKLNNDLTTYLNKNSKINESSILLKEAEQLRESFASITDKGTLSAATQNFQLFKSEVSATGFATKSTAEKIKDMLSHVTKIGSLFGVASLAVNNFKQSLETLKSNDTILTEISKTSEMTKKQLEELGDTAFKVASKYGQLSSNYLLGVQEMARSGYENLSKELGELSLLTQSAGDMTADNANNYLLATDAAYKYQGSIEKLTAALDGANYISNKNSAALTDIADATSVSASFAANAGIAIDELTAAEATMIATTKRSGSEMGRAFRSIILNLQQVSGEFDGEVIDEEQLAKVEARCHSLGVELEYVKDGVATLRNPMEVLKELAEVYNSLPDNSAEKQGLISDLGGKYHANALSSLLSRWDLYEKMLSEFSQGTGSALEEARKTAESWEGRLNSLQNSWDSFVNSLTNQNAVKGGISFLDKMIQGSEALVDNLGEITVAMTAINTAMVAINKDYGIRQIRNEETGKLDIQGNIFGIDITAIKNQKKHFNEAAEAIDGWNQKLAKGVTDINSFNNATIQNNAQLKNYLSTCSKDAPASLAGYKQYLTEAGVSTDALRLKTVMLNAAISFGLGLVIQLAVEGITKLANASKECAENAEKLMDSYKSAISAANANAETVEGLIDRYEELSKGVDKLGHAIYLTTDEYAEYNSIANQIADMFPTLVQGYTDEGNAILSLKGNVEELRDAYKEAQQEAYNLLVASGKDSDGNDIIKNANNVINGTTDFFGNRWSRGKIEENAAYGELLDSILSNDYEEIKATIQKFREGRTDWMLDGIGVKWSDIYDVNGLVATGEELYAIQQQIRAKIQTNQAEIDAVVSNVQTLANAYLLTNEDYYKLEEESKSVASIVVNSINEGIVTGFEDKEDVGAYVANILTLLNDNKDVKDAMVGLFTLDAEDMQPDKVKAVIDQYINYIAGVLDEDADSLKIRLGFDSTDELAAKYENALNAAREKFGVDVSRFFKENSINTQEEIDAWLEIAKSVNTAAEAQQKYLKLGQTAKSYGAFDLDEFKDTINSIESGYQSLLDAKQEYEDNGGFLSPSTIAELTESGLIQYLEQTEKGIRFNTDAYLENAEAVKQNAIQQLYGAMCHDVEAIAIGNVSEISAGAQTNLTNIGLVAEESGEKASISSGGWYELATSIAAVKSVMSDEVQGATGTTKKQIDSTIKYYQNLANIVSNIDVGKTTKAKGGSSSSSSSTKETDYKSILDKEITAQEKAQEAGLINFKQYLDNRKKLVEDYYKSGKISAEEYKDELKELAEAQYDYYQKVLSAVTKRIDKEIDGIDLIIEGLEKQNDKLESQKDIYESALSAITAYLDAQKDLLQDDIDLIEKENDGIQGQIDKYDQMLGAVTIIINERTEALQAEQDAIDEQIASLQSVNDEQEKALKLEQAKDALEKARNSRTKYLYSGEERGFIYQADYEAIADAEKDLSDIEFDNAIDALEKEKELLQDIIDQLAETEEAWQKISSAFDDQKNLSAAQELFGDDYKNIILNGDPDTIAQIMTAYIDAQQKLEDNASLIESIEEKMDNLDKIKEKWDEVATAYEDALDRENAALLLGQEWQAVVLADRTEDYENFKNNYLSIQAQIDDNQSLIDSYNEKVEYYEKLKEKWESIGDAYKDTVNTQLIALEFGANGEAEILSGRAQTIETFKNNYLAAQQAMADAAWAAANEEIAAAKEAEKGAKGTSGSAGNIASANTTPTVDNPSSSNGKHSSKNMTYVAFYGGGTTNARKGVNLVGEEGEELYIDNHGGAALVTEPTLINMEGGETVKSAEETKDMYASSDFTLPEPEKILAKPAIDEVYQMLGIDSPFFHSGLLESRISNLPQSKIINNYNNQRQTNVNIGDIHLHEVQNVDGLSRQIIANLPNKVTQMMYKQ